MKASVQYNDYLGTAAVGLGVGRGVAMIAGDMLCEKLKEFSL